MCKRETWIQTKRRNEFMMNDYEACGKGEDGKVKEGRRSVVLSINDAMDGQLARLSQPDDLWRTFITQREDSHWEFENETSTPNSIKCVKITETGEMDDSNALFCHRQTTASQGQHLWNLGTRKSFIIHIRKFVQRKCWSTKMQIRMKWQEKEWHPFLSLFNSGRLLS